MDTAKAIINRQMPNSCECHLLAKKYHIGLLAYLDIRITSLYDWIDTILIMNKFQCWLLNKHVYRAETQGIHLGFF